MEHAILSGVSPIDLTLLLQDTLQKEIGCEVYSFKDRHGRSYTMNISRSCAPRSIERMTNIAALILVHCCPVFCYGSRTLFTLTGPASRNSIEASQRCRTQRDVVVAEELRHSVASKRKEQRMRSNPLRRRFILWKMF